MTKTFTCKELGGVCEEKFSGGSLEELMQKAMLHMMSDDDHKRKIMDMEGDTGESREEWTKRMQEEFEKREEDK